MKSASKYLLAAAFLAHCSSHAQPIADGRTIRIISAFSPGGAADSLARGIADKLSVRLGQTVVVENKTGANGNLAATHVANEKPDGKTLFLTSSGPVAINQFIYKNMPFDPEKSFTPIARVAISPNILVARAKLPFSNFAGFLDYSKKNPGKLSYGSAGIGSSQHLSGELLKQMAGVDILHVPYKGGTLVMQDLIGSRLDLSFSTSAAVKFIQQGVLVPLAVTGKKRMPILPDVPSISELGYPAYESVAWYGLVAPAGLPDHLTSRLEKELGEILKDKAFVSKMEELTLEIAPSSAQEFADFIKADREKWRALAAQAGIKPE